MPNYTKPSIVVFRPIPFVAIGSKYDISSYNIGLSVKSAVWNVFAMSLESVLK